MLNKKLQKDKIREILRNNKGLANKNKSIVEDDYLEYKRLRKSVDERLVKKPETRTVARYNGIQEFLEEAYKNFLLEAEEMINKEELEAKKDISEKVSDSTSKVIKPEKEKTIPKDTKENKLKDTVSKKTKPKKSESKPKKLSETSVSKENKDVKSNKKEENIKALKHPDSKITEASKELKNPFNETNKSNSNMQIGFFGGTQEDSKKAKSKSKSTKKKSQSTSTDSMNTNLQISFLI